MAEAGEDFYRDVARAGYRGPYLRTLAHDVASGALDLEELNDPELPVEEVEARLLALPGVGPYAAAHVMLTSLGRYSRLVLDSWTRPTYAKLAGRKASDKTIARKFRPYGEFAGLAFWLLLTRGWVPESRLHVEEHGSGETLLLHQGLGQGSWAWRYVAPVFAERFRTIVFDTRGTGLSPVPDEPYGIGDLARTRRRSSTAAQRTSSASPWAATSR